VIGLSKSGGPKEHYPGIGTGFKQSGFVFSFAFRVLFFARNDLTWIRKPL
jgi:hypothetical protein